MIRNYFKIALRSIAKQRGYAVINILGLAVGMACVLLILLYVTHETNYDGFHKDKERLFRVLRVAYEGDNKSFIGVTSAPFAPALHTDFPQDVEETCRILANDGLVTYQDKSFREKKLYFGDENTF